MMSRWLMVAALGGCGESQLTWSPDREEEPQGDGGGGSADRAPGRWNVAAAEAGVDVSLIRTGLLAEGPIVADDLGDRFLFAAGGNACAVDGTTGAMDTDVDVDGADDDDDEDDAGDVDVPDAGEEGSMLAVSSAGISLVAPGEGSRDPGEVVEHVPGAFRTARSVGGDLVGVREECAIDWEGWTHQLPADACDAFESTASEDALFVATSEGVLRVEHGSATLVDLARAQHLAWDGVAGRLLTAVDDVVLGAGWFYAPVDAEGAPAAILDLLATDDLGLALVHVAAGRDRRLDVVDAETGALLGVLDVGNGTEDLVVSRSGGLLLQRRSEDVVSWRITR